MNKFLFVILFALTLSSCATFSDNYTNGNIEKLNSRNISQLNGIYQMYASGEYNEKGHFTSISTSKKKYPLYKKIENTFPNVRDQKDIEKIIRNTRLDSIPSLWNSYDQVEVKIKDDYISFGLIKDNNAVKVLNYKGTLKNGFIYLPKENNCFKVLNSAENCVKSQRRIGLADDGSLILHEFNDVNASSKYTSFLISMTEGEGNAVYKYKKIK